MFEYKGLSEFVEFNNEFRNAINIDLNLNHKGKLLSYIPTKSSVDILKRYMKAIQGNIMHASMLIGPYGKGKSHLLLVLLGILTLDRNNEAEKKIFDTLYERIYKVDNEAAELMLNIWQHKSGRFLPVIVNCQSDVNQAFLLALSKSLKLYGLTELTPKTDYEYAVEIVENWKENYKDTYEEYHRMLKSKKITLTTMKAELLQYNKKYLDIFRLIYPELTSGSVFNPLAEADVTRLYMSVADKIREEYGFRGIYIVFDEFSKFIEGQDRIASGLNMKLVQDVCEMAGDSKDPEIYITLVAHKPIKEYGNRLSVETINSFTGIEGRLDAEIQFITSAKNNYELISNAILKNDSDIEKVPSSIYDMFFTDKARSVYHRIPAFESEFTYADFEKIVVRGCYPLTPVSAYMLLNVSEKVAQNERTLFTFISNEEVNSMSDFVSKSVAKNNVVSSKWFITPDLIYDYFSNLFKDESDEIKAIYQKSVSAIEIACTKYNEADLAVKIIKTIALFMIVDRMHEMPWDEETVRIALNMHYSEVVKEHYNVIMSNLLGAELDILEKDSNGLYKFKTVEGKELQETIGIRWASVANDDTIDACLANVYNTKYVFPKKYNYEYGMTRYFRYKFIEINKFLALKNDDKLFEDGLFCDGKVICIFKFDENNYSQQIADKLYELSSHRIIAMYSNNPLECKEEINKLQVANDIKEDISFIDKNRHLVTELSDLIDNLENKILIELNERYGRFSNYETSYFYNGNVIKADDKSITQCTDELCYAMYNETPVINNEFVNKYNVSTGATKSARKNIITRLLQKEDLKDYLKGTSQDATIFRSLFVQNGLYNNKPEKRIKIIIDIIQDYFEKCAGEKISFDELIKILISEPYGIRLGLIPIYVAYVIGTKDSDVIVYYGDKEIPLTTEVIINMCDSPEEYSFYISRSDIVNERYIKELCELFKVKIDSTHAESRISLILSNMQKWYRSLPQVTLSAKKDKVYYSDSGIAKAVPKLGNILQRYEINPYEAVFSQIPSALEAGNDYTMCIKRLKNIKQLMSQYYTYIVNKTIDVTRDVFSNQDDSLYHIVVEWYDEQSEVIKGTISDQAVSEFMHTISRIKQAAHILSESEVVDKLAKAVTGVFIDYWNADTLDNYETSLRSMIENIQNNKDAAEYKDNKLVYMSRSGTPFYYENSTDESTVMFRDVLEGTINDFDGLSKNDIISVLLDAVERVLNDEE